MSMILLSISATPGYSEPPALEVIDHIRGFKFTTYSDRWAFSPIGKFGVIIVDTKAKIRLSLKKSMFNKTPTDTVKSRLTQIGKNANATIVFDKTQGMVAGSLTATGLTWSESRRNRSKGVRELWFNYGGLLYETGCESPLDLFPQAIKECDKLLADIRLLK